MKEYTILLKKSGEQWVSLCLELSVTGCGRTRKEAMDTLKDAVESYLCAMKDDGLSPDSPVPLDLLHEFLAGESLEQTKTSHKLSAEVGVFAYGAA